MALTWGSGPAGIGIAPVGTEGFVPFSRPVLDVQVSGGMSHTFVVTRASVTNVA